MDISTNHNIIISAPIGGYANHLIWLIWSNLRFNSSLTPDYDNISEATYNSIKGIDWPTYATIINDERDAINQLPLDIKIELRKYNLLYSPVADPINFVLTEIYNSDRNWNNWILNEWKWREQWPSIIPMHAPIVDIDAQKFYIFCTANEDMCFRQYLKFNSLLNNQTASSFKRDAAEFNSIVKDRYNHYSNVLILDNNKLDHDDLNIEYYQTLISFLNLNDDYAKASQLHTAWRQCHTRAAKDFLRVVTELYSK